MQLEWEGDMAVLPSYRKNRWTEKTKIKEDMSLEFCIIIFHKEHFLKFRSMDALLFLPQTSV